MAFSLEAKLFRGWRASVEQRQAGSLRVGCGLLAAGCWSSLVVLMLVLVLMVWQQQNFWLAWLAWLAGGGGASRPFRLGPFARLRCCNSRRKHRCFGAAHPAAAAALAAPLLAHGFKQRAGQQAYGGDVGCVWESRQDAVRASEARIGVSCTGRALQSACSIFLQGLTGRGAFCWPPFAALLLVSLLALTGMLEGVREWGRALSVLSSLRDCVALSQIRPCNTTPSGQARSGCQICTGNNIASLLGLGPWGSRSSSLSGGCSRTIPINLAGVCNCTRPTSPGISPAFKHTTKEFCAMSWPKHPHGLLQPSFCTHVQSSVAAADSSGLRAKETLQAR
jgi:hypothetical protein